MTACMTRNLNPNLLGHPVFFRTDTRLEEFKKRFRRSGSLGVPFFPEEDIRSLKASGFLRTFSRNNFGKLQSQMAIEEDDEEGTGVVTLIVKTSKAANMLQTMLQALPVLYPKYSYIVRES